MNSSTVSTGDSRPYVLAVTSHKGGTGRTTFACGLAWAWGQCGLRVALVDADPVRAAALVAAKTDEHCPWPNVRLFVAERGHVRVSGSFDAIVIDAPPATEPLAQKVFSKSDGAVVCCLADSLALATLPAATRSIREARTANPSLALLGIVVNLFAPADVTQVRCLSMLRGARGGLFVEPPIPARPEIRAWPLAPGSDLPEGPARRATLTLADTLRESIAAAGWRRFASRMAYA